MFTLIDVNNDDDYVQIATEKSTLNRSYGLKSKSSRALDSPFDLREKMRLLAASVIGAIKHRICVVEFCVTAMASEKTNIERYVCVEVTTFVEHAAARRHIDSDRFQVAHSLNSILFFNAHEIHVTNSIIALTDGRRIAAVKLELMCNCSMASSRLSTMN
jgi:hypothetical protein